MNQICKPAAAVAAVLLLGAATGAVAAEGKGASIEGVWKVTGVVITGANPLTIAQPQESVYIFAHGHYATVSDQGEKARSAAPAAKDPAKPTDAEKLAKFEEWRVVSAQAGTYEFKGGKLTRKPTVAENVGAVTSGAYDTDVAITGDTMVMTSHAPAGQPARDQKVTFARVK